MSTIESLDLKYVSKILDADSMSGWPPERVVRNSEVSFKVG